MKKGIFVFRGKTLEPPYIIRQEADRILLNDQQIYPLPEIKEPPKREAVEPLFPIPQKVEDVLGDFYTSWQSGLIKDEKNRIKNACGFERDQNLIKDTEDRIMDADIFIEDYENQKKALIDVLKSEDIPCKETEEYHDILIPIEKEWGVIALFNEAERIRVIEEVDKKCPITPTYPYRDAAKFKTYVKTALTEGDVLIMDEGVMEFIPHHAVEDMEKEISGFDTLEPPEKVDELRKKLPLDYNQPYPRIKSAVIFLPFYSWQKRVTGSHARYPFSLATSLKSRRYRVWMFTDDAVSLDTWSKFLSKGHTLNIKAIYNQGHGNKNLIAVGTSRRGGNYYFTDQFVYRYANLRKTIVYVYSCLTLADDRLAAAFLNKGACTYGGWKTPALSNPRHCDTRDSIFWRPIINVGSTTGDACRALNTFDPTFECRGNNRCKLR
ncbi:MAG: hypothetical protein PVF58_22410 [Candidatus Methanofastidiosia archaeon]|jgi:hypothetical protein